ncbi:MAG: cephalosporin hydroxylase family protein [Proteobacteria bacterium]|nr:cephalosporin hydroxylase [Desulfobacula sp.]MBU3952648.1 cephalosporin hydroxylase family protein [Pseudomonadota bacterium]MBU4133598.1 cephalosporin hydroxylase family protein [Pseudomonadota bacterium]
MKKFEQEVKKRIADNRQNKTLRKDADNFMMTSLVSKYSYNFSWLGRPIIQYPQDIIAMQELIWETKPDLIIETGIAHGGSLIMYASFLEMIGHGHVLGIDIDIRKHNRNEIEKHPMFKRITLLEGSSISDEIADKVVVFARDHKKILVVLDSNHTHEHVLKELNLYSPLVSKGSYIVVFDTIVEDMPNESFLDRPWGKGNNPKTAVWKFLETNDRFAIDKQIENKLLITVSPDGFLKCIKNL